MQRALAGVGHMQLRLAQRQRTKTYCDEHGRRREVCYKMGEYNNMEGENGAVGITAHGSSFDTYSLYACRSSPDTKDTHTPLRDRTLVRGK